MDVIGHHVSERALERMPITHHDITQIFNLHQQLIWQFKIP
jgi:hypothetical protein